MYTAVQDQMRKAFRYIQDNFDNKLLEQVLWPNQIIEVHIPVQMDNGETKVFTGLRSQHNNAKGPYKGGLRFHPQVSKDEVMSLSAWMSLKTSVVGIPLGGGKGGIIVNPKELSTKELEQLSRGYIQKIYKHIGPLTDVPAPDVNTNGQIMAWMVDEYSKLVGQRSPGAITGKPLAIGGSAGRTEATSRGGLLVLETYIKSKKDTLKNKTIAIQGAGNVGLHFALLAQEAGAKICAISDSRAAIYDPAGLNVAAIAELKANRKPVSDYPGKHEIITNEALLELEVDVVVPAALEQVIHQDNANQIKAPVILELANGPVTPEADAILDQKGSTIIPDILANAGGVTVSYFEQVQNNTNYYRPEAEVNQKLADIMIPATSKVIETAEKHKSSLRNAAYIVSLERILEAMKLRGM